MRASLAACVSASAVAACGGGVAAVPPAAPVELATFVDRWCALVAPCCAPAGLATDGVQCHKLMATASAGTDYDPARGGACLAEVEAARTQAGFCAGGGATPACEHTFTSRGTQPPGGACAKQSDCASSNQGTVTCHAWLPPGASAPSGTCVLEVDGAVGDHPCIGDKAGNLSLVVWGVGAPPAQGYVCLRAAGAYCAPSGTCAALGSAGAACSGDAGCADGTFCDLLAGRCAARGGAGAACKWSSGCLDAYTCDPGTSRCVARLSDGAACTSTDQCARGSDCLFGACEAAPSLSLLFVCGKA